MRPFSSTLPPLNAHFDLAVIGSGFGGTLLAMIARQSGRRVLLLERGSHPRFAIGESSTPLANLFLEEIARRYSLPQLLPLTNWGDWQRTHPYLPVGLKRGFAFFQQDWQRPFQDDQAHARQLLVAASPSNDVADTHWFRADFDALLVTQAQELGVDYLDNAHLDSLEIHPASVRLCGRQHDQPFSLTARFIVDASGPRGFLFQQLGLSESPLPSFPRTQALFSHFVNVPRLELSPEFQSLEPPPFPIDDAAVHHIFPGGWIWVLRFNHGLTSAGVAATDPVARELAFSEGAPAWDRLLGALPSLQTQFAAAQVIRPFSHAPRLSFSCPDITGPNWALLPSAAGFVDPLLSTGIALTLLGVLRLGTILDRANDADLAAGLENYARQTRAELAFTSELIGSLYANFHRFPVFSALSLLYFAAAIYSETAYREGRDSELLPYILATHSPFAEQARACFKSALDPAIPAELIERQILDTIAPINIAGLADPSRRNWYPAHAF